MEKDAQPDSIGKEETADQETVPDSTTLVAGGVDSIQPTASANTIENDTLDVAVEPNLNLAEHSNYKTRSPVTDGGENSDEIPTSALEDLEGDLSLESQNNKENETFTEHESFNLESENLNGFNGKTVETIRNSVQDDDKPYDAVLEVKNSVETKTDETFCHQDQNNVTIRIDDSDVDMQTSVITIEDTFEESPCKQPQVTERLLNSTIITTSFKNNLITQSTTNPNEPTRNIEEQLSNTIIIGSPKKKLINETVTEHVDYNIAHLDVLDVDSQSSSERVAISDQDSFIRNKNECLGDNTYETSKVNQQPSLAHNKPKDVKTNVECSPRKIEVNMNDVLIVIDDSLKESTTPDNNKISPVISIDSSEADQDEILEVEDVAIDPLNQHDVANETFATCRQSLNTRESLEFTNAENSELVIINCASLGPVEMVGLESTVSQNVKEDVVAYSAEAHNSTEDYLVSALEALNISSDDKDDTFLSCQENREQSNIEDSLLHEGYKTSDNLQIPDKSLHNHSAHDTLPEDNVDEEVVTLENEINKTDETADVLATDCQVSEKNSKSILYGANVEGNNKETHVIGMVHSPRANIEDVIKSDNNSSSETVTLEDNISHLSIEPGDMSPLTLVQSGGSPQVIHSVIKSHDNAEKVPEIVRFPEPSIEQETTECNKNTTCETLPPEDDKINLSAEVDISRTKSELSYGPQAVINDEDNAEEISEIVIHSPETIVEQDTTDSIKNISSQTITAEDSNINVSAVEKVDETNIEEASNAVNSPKSITENDIIDGNQHVYETTLLNDNKSDLSTEADDISPLKSFASADVSITSCDTPERSVLSYSALMEASPSIFAQQVTTYEKQTHLKLRINELEQTVAKLKLQLRQKEAVIMKLQMEKITDIKDNEKISKTPLPVDSIVKNLQKYKDDLAEAKMKIVQLENKCETERNLLEAKIKAQEQDLANYSILKNEYEETLDRLKDCEQKNFDMLLQIEQAVRDKKKAYNTMEKYEKVTFNFATTNKNLKECLQAVTSKYEKAKTVVLGLKSNEDLYKTENEQLQNKLKDFAQQYENFKLQALSQIEEANKENLKLKNQIQEKKVKKNVGKK